MAQQGGLQGLGAPINYYESMVPDFRREALMETQNRLGQQQVASQQMQNQQAQIENQRKSQFYDAISTATPDQLPALRKQFPEYAQNIQQEIGIQDATHAKFVNDSLGKIQVAYASGDPQQVQSAIQSAAPALGSIGVQPEQAMQMFQSNPQQFGSLLNASMLSTLPIDKQYEVKNKEAVLNENIRSNKAGEGLQAMQIAQSRENSIRAASGQNSQPASVKEFQYFQSLSPEQQKTYMRVRGRPDAGGGNNVVKLADGRTVTVAGKLHGAGATAFYEGMDDDGNMVRVPANAIAAPPTSAANAQNFAMSKDLDVIENASPDSLEFMTGLTGGRGNAALGADVRSRVSGKDQRQLYNAAQRVQGKMQNQGIAAARDMGASGINTVAEAKMYFQGMPQVDYSGADAIQQSIKDIRQYTNDYNQQYDVNVGGGRQAETKKQAVIEGATATNPKTGQKMIFRSGQWQPM